MAKLDVGYRSRSNEGISGQQATAYYIESTILALPTYFQEGLPMTLLQGAAAGLPIITTKISAAADYLTEPANCLWVEPQDPSMLANCICKLLDRSELRESMKKCNLALAKDFAVETVAKEYLRLFEEISVL